MMKKLFLFFALCCTVMNLFAADEATTRRNSLDGCTPFDITFDGSGSIPQSLCWQLCTDVRKIYVIPGTIDQEPIVSVVSGCETGSTNCSSPCNPSTDWYFASNWYFMDNHWCRDVGGNGCICVTLEGYVSTCVPTDTYFDGNGALPQYNCWTLCWPIQRKIYVIPGQADREPIVSITLGCSPANGSCDENCVEATYYEYRTDWYFMDDHWCRDLVASGCVCVCLEGYLAVELLSFSANPADQSVSIAWQTATEPQNDHFEILRDNIAIATIPTAGSSSSGQQYHFTDSDVVNGRTYRYALVAVDVNGQREELATENATPLATLSIAKDFELLQNYPNPFNPATDIRFYLNEAGLTELTIFDLLGKEVAVLVNGTLEAGLHSVSFDATELPAGVYIYRLQSGGFSAVKKMALVK